LRAVQIEDKGTHGFRRYFITYARADCASPDVLERRTLLDFRPSADRVWDTFFDTQVDPGRKLNEFNPKNWWRRWESNRRQCTVFGAR
jgi:hypothetical protein